MKKGITGNTLKWIAIITMFIDHIGAAVLERGMLSFGTQYEIADNILRYIGRVSFPIMCFLLVEGFLHTRNLRRYALSLSVFALISEIPFDLAFFGEIYWGYQNVYFTLLFGLLAMWIGRKILESGLAYSKLLFFIPCIVFAGLAELISTDYGAIGVILILLLYTTKRERVTQSVVGALWMSYEITSVFAFVLTYMYNGVRKKGMNKYFFYWFYPLHLLFLYGVHLYLQ